MGAQQASMPTTHDDEDLLQIDEDAMEEIDIRWQVAMITARIRKFMRKTGRPIDLKPKNGITFDKSKIECFNCQKLGHFARECRFAKYQENRANGFNAEPVTFAMMALTELEEDDWSMEIDAEPVHFGQDGLGDFDWSNKADDTPVSLALMATNSEGTIIPPRANVSFTGIDELAIRNKVVNQENTKSSQPEIDRNKVIIEDWVDSDDEETALNFSEIQKKTVLNSENSETSFENRSPNSQNSVGQGSRKKGLGHKGGKTCFVCYSPDHLIKDCDLHERTFKQTQTHKPKGTQGSRDTRPVWNNINRVNHSNFSENSRYPHQKRSFIPSAVLTREGLKSTARPKMTQTVPSKSTANVFYQGTARPRVPQAVLSQSTGRPYYPRMDNIRPRTSSFSPSTRSSTTRTPHRPQRPKKIMKSIWVKKESTVGSQAVLPQNVSVKGSAMINPTQTWRPKGAYLDSVNRDNGSYTLKQFEYGNPEEDLKDYAIIDSGCSGSMTGDKDKLSDFKEFKDGKRVIGTKWVFRNKRDERGTIIKNKARLVAQGYRQEEGVDYDEVFAPVARIEAIRLFLAFASFMGFTVYQMDVKSAFLYGNITEEVYVKQPPGFEDPAHPNKVYRVVKALYGLHQAPRAWYERLSTFLLKHGYRRGAIDKTLFIKKDRRDIMLVQVYVDDIIFGSTKSSMVKDFEDLMQKEFKMSSMGELTFFLGLQVKQTTAGIFLSQDKYVQDILNKFDFRTIKPASTPIEAHKSLGKDEEGEEVDVHLYRSMIGCLMYLTASRPDIMFAVCLCARFQVTPKVSHIHAVKRIFRYLKHQPKLGLWYPKDSPFHLEAFSDSDYAGDNHDRRSTSGGCQYLGRRLVSWQCKKQTIVAISSTEAEYVAAASCCAQVLWMQNQLLDYGFNFMNTEIHIDNESTICIVKNPVLHSKTKHIQIRHHFIRDCYEQRLINVVKVHTDDNVADLLTKGFDLARFNFLVVTIGMMNP
ncbi:putative ribonuclease H-like domain-containing protein [Tanacetum coccineum]